MTQMRPYIYIYIYIYSKTLLKQIMEVSLNKQLVVDSSLYMLRRHLFVSSASNCTFV